LLERKLRQVNGWRGVKRLLDRYGWNVGQRQRHQGRGRYVNAVFARQFCFVSPQSDIQTMRFALRPMMVYDHRSIGFRAIFEKCTRGILLRHVHVPIRR